MPWKNSRRKKRREKVDRKLKNDILSGKKVRDVLLPKKEDDDIKRSLESFHQIR